MGCLCIAATADVAAKRVCISRVASEGRRTHAQAHSHPHSHRRGCSHGIFHTALVGSARPANRAAIDFDLGTYPGIDKLAYRRASPHAVMEAAVSSSQMIAA